MFTGSAFEIVVGQSRAHPHLSRVPAQRQRCVFFDRDGVINRSPGTGYVTTPEDFHLNDGIAELVAEIRAAGWLAIVITSQRCVGKGLIDLATLDVIHAKMQTELAARADAAAFDAIYAFTGLPGTEQWEKPQPGMIEQACRDHAIEASNSVMIGDRDRDIEMADRAGVGKTIRLLAEEGYPEEVAASHTVNSIGELADTVRELLSA